MSGNHHPNREQQQQHHHHGERQYEYYPQQQQQQQQGYSTPRPPPPPPPHAPTPSQGQVPMDPNQPAGASQGHSSYTIQSSQHFNHPQTRYPAHEYLQPSSTSPSTAAAPATAAGGISPHPYDNRMNLSIGYDPYQRGTSTSRDGRLSSRGGSTHGSPVRGQWSTAPMAESSGAAQSQHGQSPSHVHAGMRYTNPQVQVAIHDPQNAYYNAQQTSPLTSRIPSWSNPPPPIHQQQQQLQQGGQQSQTPYDYRLHQSSSPVMMSGRGYEQPQSHQQYSHPPPPPSHQPPGPGPMQGAAQSWNHTMAYPTPPQSSHRNEPFPAGPSTGMQIHTSYPPAPFSIHTHHAPPPPPPAPPPPAQQEYPSSSESPPPNTYFSASSTPLSPPGGGAGGGSEDLDEVMLPIGSRDRRRAQNKIAQRAFRERAKIQAQEDKDHMADLESLTTHQATQIEEMKGMIEKLRRDNEQLRRSSRAPGSSLSGAFELTLSPSSRQVKLEMPDTTGEEEVLVSLDSPERRMGA